MSSKLTNLRYPVVVALVAGMLTMAGSAAVHWFESSLMSFASLRRIEERVGRHDGSVTAVNSPVSVHLSEEFRSAGASPGNLVFETFLTVNVLSDIGVTNSLATSVYQAERPTVASSGRKILFQTPRDYEPGAGTEIYSMNPNGTDQRRLTLNGGGRDFSFGDADDLSRFTYIRQPDDYELVLFDVQTRNQTVLKTSTNALRLPRLSRDGQKIIYLEENSLRAINADGTNDRELVSSGIEEAFLFGNGPNPRVAYIRDGDSVYSNNLDGTDEQLIVASSNDYLFFSDLNISRDGTKIAFNCDTQPGIEGNGICVANIDGSELRAVGTSPEDDQPALSPDGSVVAYVREDFKTSNFEIRMVPTSGGIPETVHTASTNISHLTWAPVANREIVELSVTSPLAAGRRGLGTILLPEPAPSNGAVVWLSSSDYTIVNPGTVANVPAGQSFVQFEFTTSGSPDYRSAEIIATRGARAAVATVSVSPAAPDVAASDLNSPPVLSTRRGGATLTWTVTNNGEAPTPVGRDDRIFLSPDEQLFNGNDTQLLQNYDSTGALDVGESRVRSSVLPAIPESAAPVDGTYYLFVYAGFQLNERGGDFSNNAVRRAVQVTRRGPDLIIESIEAPALVEPDTLYQVNWTVRNQGPFDTGNSFTHRLFLSFDQTAGNSDDILVVTRNAPPLAENSSFTDSATFTVPSVPERPTGEIMFYAIADTANTVDEGDPGSIPESNNSRQATTRFEYNVPDLTISGATAPAEVETGAGFTFAWTTSNVGRKTAARMTERIYFSTDNQADAGDILIGTFPLPFELEPNQTAERAQTLTIPTSAVTASGNYFVYVVTDALGQINEGVFENNNVRFAALNVIRQRRPDLRVGVITAPANAFFGQEIQLQFVVTNEGSGPTSAAQWTDRIMIGVGSEISGATQIGTISNLSSLNPGESYVTTASVRIPRGLTGPHRLFVQADANQTVVEDVETNNNNSRPIALAVPPLPDLRVATVQAPDEGFAGSPVEVSWAVTNGGDGGTAAGLPGFSDGVYLSRDQTFDAGDQLIGTRPQNALVPASGSYAVTNFAVTLPPDAIGEYYVFVVADYANQVYEFQSENNNDNFDRLEPGSPLTVAGTPPDLETVGPLIAPVNQTAGRAVNVQFTVRNVAPFDANGNWSDAVYLSTDQVFSPQTDTLLVAAGRNFVAAGNQYTVNINATLPNCLNGTFYLFGVADTYRTLYEFDPNSDAESNNVTPPREIQIQSFFPDLQVTSLTVPPVVINGAMPVSWRVRNLGSAAATTGWSDRVALINNGQVINLGIFDRTTSLAPDEEYVRSEVVYIPLFLEGEVTVVVETDTFNLVPECSFENNNQTSGLTNGAPTLADLRVTNVVAPSTVTVGQPFNMTWTGQNNGEAMSSVATWVDGVYLSSDAVWSPDDRRLGGAGLSRQLGTNETYLREAQFATPNVTAGNYFLLVRADDTGTIEEGTDEGNNVSLGHPITLTSPDCDLSVNAVSTTPVVFAGQPATITWTVTNSGAQSTPGGDWTDYVYLSRDSIIDQSDQLLGWVPNTATLAPGGSYTRSVNLNVPVGFAGEFRIIVVTDRNGTIAESNEANNVGTPFVVDVQLPAPVDFRVAVATPPAFASPGEISRFEWTVQNFSANAAGGTWQDSVYLSADPNWDSSDLLVVRKEHSGTVGPFGTYTEAANVALPPLVPGQYYMIVRTDARNSVRESDETNNLGTSVSRTSVTIAALTLGVPLTTTLAVGDEKHYSIGGVPLGETLLIRLNGETGARNELFSRRDTPATRSEFDFQGVRQGEPNQTNVIPEASGELYYTLARSDFIPASFGAELRRNDDIRDKTANSSAIAGNNAQNITLQAEILPFGVRDISPASAGNAGYTAVQIDGAQFRPGATARLERAGKAILPIGHAVATARIAAIFDLRGKGAGTYDVVVTNPDGSSATLPGAFTITAGGGYDLRVAVLNPTPTRGGIRRRFTFSVANDGRNDARNVPVLISVPAAYGFELDRSNLLDDTVVGLPVGTRAADVPLSHVVGDERVFMLYAPLVRAGQSIEMRIDLDLPVNYGQFPVTIRALPPMEDWAEALVRDDPQALTNLLEKNVAQFGNQTPPPPNPRDCWLELFRQIFFGILGQVLPTKCEKIGWSLVNSSFDTASSLLLAGATGNLDGWNLVGTLSGRLINVLSALAECGLGLIPLTKALIIATTIVQILNQLDDCLGGKVKQRLLYTQPFSVDPNEKLGPVGFGPEKWIGVQKPIEYRINFENLPTAGAPAQVIRITDVLPATLDPRTVRLTEIGFNHKRVVIPPNRSFFQARRSFSENPEEPEALVSAGINPANGTISWTITAIDKQTNERPVNPLVGLLPPNNVTRDGEGYVLFTVVPRATVGTGSEIANSATIIFDENEPIVTNTAVNMLDAETPESAVAPLPPTSDEVSFPVTWSGSDAPDGSGLASFELLVSEDGGPYRQVVADTTETTVDFVGRRGHVYGFVTLARDNAGNIEALPDSPDTVVRIRGGAYEADVAPRPDGDNDGRVNMADVEQIRRYVVQLETDFTFNEFQRADVAPQVSAGDGRLSAADVMLARRYAAGLEPVADVAGPVGPVTGSTGFQKTRVGSGSRSLRVVRTTRAANVVTLAVEVNSDGTETGFSFTLNYDPAKLGNPRNFATGGDFSGAAVASRVGAAGRIGIALDRAPGASLPAGTRRILTLEFDVLTPDPTTTITFGDEIAPMEVVSSTAAPLPAVFEESVVLLITPTAGTTRISGTVRNQSGEPLGGVAMTLTNSAGRIISARTNSFGHFRFNDVETGQSYILRVSDRRFRFNPSERLIDVVDEVSGLEIVGCEELSGCKEIR